MKRNVLLLIAVALLLPVLTPAQQAQLVFHPGDAIHILITFKEAPKMVDDGVFRFDLVGNPSKSQEGLPTLIQGSSLRKISDTQFEITGMIPQHIASGSFQLDWINIGSSGAVKTYRNGSDFNGVAINVLSPDHPDFPAIDSVKVTP